MNKNLAIFSACLVLVCYLQCTRANFIIGTFNVQSLGSTKMSRPDFVSILVKILARYDVVSIQEIKDSTGLKVMVNLVSSLNKFVQGTGVKYDFVISPRLGSGSYKEQLAFLYR